MLFRLCHTINQGDPFILYGGSERVFLIVFKCNRHYKLRNDMFKQRRPKLKKQPKEAAFLINKCRPLLN